MRTIDTPQPDERAAPEFTDADGARAWLEMLPLANAAAAQRSLLAALAAFDRADVPPAERFAVLEALREAVHYVQIEQAKRFAHRALPMTAAELAVFDATVALWELMRTGYRRCIAAAAGGEAPRADRAALLCQRLLACAGLRMFHHHRAYRQIPRRDWRALHEGYAIAERLGVAETPVKDWLNRDVHDTSPRIAWMRAVLMALANPNELAPRQLTFTAYLLERWAGKVGVSAVPGADEGGAPLAVDLAADAPAQRRPLAGASVRYLDLTRLARSLRSVIGLMRRGESPAKLGLGEDCVQPACERLLAFLYGQWCRGREPRTLERRPAATFAQVSNDLEAIWHYMSGRVFRQPTEGRELTPLERAELATFGRLSTREEDDYSDARGFLLEHWQIIDESATGLGLRRPAEAPGRRHAHGELVAVRPADAKAFMLGQLRWLMQDEAGGLEAGVRLIPGSVGTCAVRPTGLNAGGARFVPALTLGPLPEAATAPTLILPAGLYRPKRVIEFRGESGTRRLMLLELVERGSDYERVTFRSAD